MIAEAFIIAMLVLFIYTTYREKHIFGFLAKWYKNWMPEKMWKPVFDCPICMTPWYGTIIYWLLFNISVVDWLVVIGVASGINVLAVYLHEISENLKLKNGKF